MNAALLQGTWVLAEGGCVTLSHVVSRIMVHIPHAAAYDLWMGGGEVRILKRKAFIQARHDKMQGILSLRSQSCLNQFENLQGHLAG
jgi:hypothetical protein